MYNDIDNKADDMYRTDGGFLMEWLPRVSGTLKSLSISDFAVQSFWRRSIVLYVVSAHCHNLVELELKSAWLSVDKLKPMPMLTSLTLEFILLDDKNLTELNKGFPNLQVLNLINVIGLQSPTIHLLNLKTCHWTIPDEPSSLSLITPNLITLRVECKRSAALYVAFDHYGTLTVKVFENLKTLWLESFNIFYILVRFPLTETLENLTLDTRWLPDLFTKFTLEKLFSVFPSMTSLCFKSEFWNEYQDQNDQFGWEALDSAKGLKTFRGYFLTVKPLSIYSTISSVLDQCVNLVNVSLLIHRDEAADASEEFISWCMACWPKVNWRWGTWEEGKEDTWITVNSNAYEYKQSFKEA